MFLLHHSECERYLKGVIKAIDTSAEDKDSAEAELKFLKEEADILRETLKAAKENEKTLKAAFNNETNTSENSKLKGQPVRAKVEDMMRIIGVNRGEYYGRKLEGNGCRKIMANRVEFADMLSNYVVSTDN